MEICTSSLGIPRKLIIQDLMQENYMGYQQVSTSGPTHHKLLGVQGPRLKPPRCKSCSFCPRPVTLSPLPSHPIMKRLWELKRREPKPEPGIQSLCYFQGQRLLQGHVQLLLSPWVRSRWSLHSGWKSLLSSIPKMQNILLAFFFSFKWCSFRQKVYRKHFDGCQMGEGLGEWMKKVKGLRSTNW